MTTLPLYGTRCKLSCAYPERQNLLSPDVTPSQDALCADIPIHVTSPLPHLPPDTANFLPIWESVSAHRWAEKTHIGGQHSSANRSRTSGGSDGRSGIALLHLLHALPPLPPFLTAKANQASQAPLPTEEFCTCLQCNGDTFNGAQF
jgi:hypothetical protein